MNDIREDIKKILVPSVVEAVEKTDSKRTPLKEEGMDSIQKMIDELVAKLEVAEKQRDSAVRNGIQTIAHSYQGEVEAYKIAIGIIRKYETT